MKYNVWKEIIKFLKEHSLQKRVRKVLVCLAAVVVFCTVYALILPAITMEATCGLEEHTHTDECYEIKINSNREMACSLEVHSHTAECTDTEGNAICGESELVVHKHDDNCYKDGLIICTLPEITVHEHSEECYDENSNIVCDKEELVLHTHGEACYDEAGALICEETEVTEHVHTDDCFTVTDEPEEKVVVCGETEHTHNDDCYPKVVTSTKTATNSETTTEETTEEDTQSIETMSLEIVNTGASGDISWTVTKNADDATTYTLTISGAGAIPERFLFSSNTETKSLFSFKNQITKVVVDEGVTAIGNMAFQLCSKIVEVYIPSTVEEIGNYAFEKCKALQTVKIAEDSNLKIIGNNVFYGCEKLTEITIPSKVNNIGNNVFIDCFSLKSVNFAEDIDLDSVGSFLFYNCSSLEKITIPSSMKAIANYSFGDCSSLKTISFAANSEVISIGKYAFEGCSNLTAIEIPDSVTGIGDYAFQGCSSLTEITIPADVTSLGNYAFNNCSALERVNFEGPNDITMQETTFGNNMSYVLQNVSGSYYVDEQGLLYKLNEDGTATVTYASPALIGCVIPQTITTESGITYNVTEIGYKAFCENSGLTSLVFESPSSIVNIPMHAFYNLPNLSSVNGETSLAGAEGLFTNATFGMSAFYNTALTGESSKEGEVDGTISLGDEKGAIIELVTNERDLCTGEKSLTSISISPVDNTVAANKVIHLYIDFSTSDGDVYGYTEGREYTFENGSYKAYLHKTDIGNLYYWEFPMINSGETILINMELLYPSPSSAGGTAKVWTEIVDKDSESNLYPAGQYHEIEWTTVRAPFNLTKTYNEESAQMVSDGEKMYLNNMEFTITSKKDLTGIPTSVGKDFMKRIEFTDVVELPENVRWRDGILEAIEAANTDPQNYPFTKRTVDGYKQLEVTVSEGEQNKQFVIYKIKNDNENIEDYSAEVIDGKVVVTWILTNTTSTTSEMASVTHTMYFGDAVLEIEDISELQAGDILSFNNTVEAVQHYTHSADNIISAQTTAEFYCGAANLVMHKTSSYDAGASWKNSLDCSYKGKANWFKISLSNTGVLPCENIDRVEDNLRTIYYIPGKNLQTMFDNDEQHRLSVVINAATLCTPVNQTVLRIDGSTYTITSSQYVGSNTDYDGLADVDDCYDKTENVVLTLGWLDNVLTLTVEDSTGTILQTLTIGSEKQCADIQEAFDKVGYYVTSDAQYNVIWDFEDGFRLFAGQEESFVIQSSAKISFMLLTKDTKQSYSSGNFNTSNTSYVYDGDNSVLLTTSLVNNNDDVPTDYYIYMDTSINGEAVSAGSSVKSNDILDYTVNAYKLGGGAYDTYYDAVPVVSQFTGAQVLMVPVVGNEEADWLSLAEKYNDEYYILSTPGTYNKVFIEGKYADRVVIEELAEGKGLVTRIFCYVKIVNNARNHKIYFKTLVSPKNANITEFVYAVDGEAWFNGHETHRLWNNSPELPGLQVSFAKEIVPQIGTLSTPEDDGEPAERSSVGQKESVIYRLTLYPNGTLTSLSGANICDKLPKALNNYWSAENVKIEYSNSEMVTYGDAWTVENRTETGNTSSATQQYIHWDGVKFDLKTDEKLYIYVTLTFPDEGWNNYVNTYGASILENSFYVFSAFDTVYHSIKAEAQAFLQKGVYSTGVGREESSATLDYFYSYKAFTTENSRQYYVNDTVDKGVVLYYITIANTGKTRLYLEDIQDVLPEGFTFAKMAYSSYSYSSSTSSEYLNLPYKQKLHTIYTDNKQLTAKKTTQGTTQNITYTNKAVTVNPTVETLSNGRQKVTFKLSGYNVSTDSYYGKPYLLPGNGIQITYSCYTNGYGDTEDVASNFVAMPYFDYNEGGVAVDTETTVTVSNKVGTNSTSYNILPNDGSRNLLDATQVTKEGLTVGANQNQWLSSGVTLYRDDTIKPGTSKRVYSVIDAYGNEATSDRQISGATAAETIGWAITAANTGGTALTDYTIADVMQNPYSFVAGSDSHEITYKIYDKSGTEIERIPLGYISKTDDGKIYLNSGTMYYKYKSGSYCYESSDGVPQTELVLNQPIQIVYYEDRVESTKSPEQSKVEITLNVDNDGNEVLSLRFMDDRFAIPAGGKGELILYTAAPETDRNNKIYTNMGYLIPSQEFSSIEYGSFEFYNNEKAVGSIAYMTVSYGFFTSSKVTVSETGNTANTANSHDLRNYITIATGEEEFIYTLSVTNFTDSSMDKFIIIDNLPEADPDSDLTPFGENRGSNLKVVLADNPGFTVKVIERDEDGKETGEVRILDPSQYTIEYSYDTPAVFAYETDEEIKTILQNAYWNGFHSLEVKDKEKLIQGGYWDGTKEYWTDSYAAEDKDNIRSFKLTILDDTGTLITSEDIINVSFNAKVADKVSDTENQVLDHGMTAWNSFGYRYSLSNLNIDLESSPVSAGVRIAYVPKLVKELENSVGGEFIAEKDETFRFIIHTGKALALSDNFTDDELAQALTSGSRSFTFVTVTVPQGEIISDELVLDSCNEYTYADGQWIATDTDWVWDKEDSYTVVELPIESVEYSFGSIANVARNSYNFAYEDGNDFIINVSNTHSDWSIRVNKYSSLVDLEGNNITLPGAVFGLYSPIESDKLSDAEYAELTNTIGEEAAKTVVSGGVTYYLSAIDTSDTSGIAQFDALSLSNDQYVVKELMAPSGHFIIDGTSEVVIAKNSAIENLAEIEVINRAGGAKLPETGGIGTTPYIIVGLLIMGIATYCIYKQAKRRKEGMVS